ncbi:MAG: lipid-binding SYLF domain-containing protein [Blastocatellia bacterium]
MTRIARFALSVLALAVLTLPLWTANAVSSYGSSGSKAEEKERAKKAATAFREIMGAPDQAVPMELLDRSYCIAVFPGVKKGGFIVGGQYGKGLASCRRPGGSWGAPAFFTIGGGSFGLQIGGQEVDLVLLIMNKTGVEGLLKDKFEIGAGAGASAGPVGRSAHVSTDILLKSSIVSYSRSRGLFAGLELKGAVITQDNGANREIYGRDISAREIIVDGKARTPVEIEIFPKALRTFSPKGIPR